VNAKLECIGDETINNLTTNKVVCSSVIHNVSTTKENQNDQVSTQGLPVFSGDEYNESSEFLNANEDNVASLLNFEDMRQREALPIGCSSWHRKECDLQDREGDFLLKGHVTKFDPREAILDNIIGDYHVDLTILYCLGNISMIMTIWKWLLVQTTMEGFLLKELLLSYDESYIHEVDVERMIGVKNKLARENGRRLCLEDKGGLERGILSWC
jgi:hypothetical protein